MERPQDPEGLPVKRTLVPRRPAAGLHSRLSYALTRSSTSGLSDPTEAPYRHLYNLWILCQEFVSLIPGNFGLGSPLTSPTA